MTERNESSNLAAYEQKIRERLVIDETSPSGMRWNQFASKNVRGKIAGSLDGNGYWLVGLNINGEPRRFHVHRVAWFLARGIWPKEDVDHINGDRSDNRLSNLREASRSENMCNCAMHKNNSSGVKGVTFSKKARKWQAQITHMGKVIYLGIFSNISEAERAVREAREKLHGEFTNHGVKAMGRRANSDSPS